jgi:nitroimidazol reductase NimA-like FMN-containing flavoprotein (pyridoxamine 5'-phosphate oxidase superfamily)
MDATRSRLAELNRTECLTLLQHVRLGRVGVSVDALPAIFPVFLVVLDDVVVFRTVPGTKLTAASNGAIVALEADAFDETSGQGWSVLVRGVANEVSDRGRVVAARARLHPTWIDDAPEHFVEVSADLVTGRRIRVVNRPRPGRGSPPPAARQLR